MQPVFPIVILISGQGSNLQAIIDAIKQHQYPIEIKAVISNKATALGLQRAEQAGLQTAVLPTKNYPDRQTYDHGLLTLIDRYQPKLVVLAGFMRILSAAFVTHFKDRLINIHPSLLPKYKGLNTHQRVLDAADKIHGCSIHFVTNELDSGTIIAQLTCPVKPTDTVASLAEKVHQLEHQLYPKVINAFATRKISANQPVL